MNLYRESVGRGRPLVLLHGWAMHSGLWAPLLPRLVDRYRVHLIDLPGHGRSAVVAPYTLDTLADAVAAACHSIAGRYEQPIVLGWSLGGAVAMQWALRAPQAIGRLILVCASPCFVRRADWSHAMEQSTLRRFGDELTIAYKATLQRFVALQVQGSDDAHDLLAQLRQHLFDRGEPSKAALLAALELLAVTDLRADIPAIRHPTLVVGGERDTLVPAAATAWLAGALAHGRHVLFSHAAHAPFLSHPEAFVAAVDAFVASELARAE